MKHIKTKVILWETYKKMKDKNVFACLPNIWITDTEVDIDIFNMKHKLYANCDLRCLNLCVCEFAFKNYLCIVFFTFLKPITFYLDVQFTETYQKCCRATLNVTFSEATFILTNKIGKMIKRLLVQLGLLWETTAHLWFYLTLRSWKATGIVLGS